MTPGAIVAGLCFFTGEKSKTTFVAVDDGALSRNVFERMLATYIFFAGHGATSLHVVPLAIHGQPLLGDQCLPTEVQATGYPALKLWISCEYEALQCCCCCEALYPYAVDDMVWSIKEEAVLAWSALIGNSWTLRRVSLSWNPN